jgi:hypothetical protein
MFDFLIGFGIEGLALPPLNKFVMEGSLDEQEHLLISNMLGDLENNWASDFLECLEYDKLFVKNIFCSLVYQKNLKGQIRLSRNPAEVIWGRRRSQRMTEHYWQRKSLKAYTILVWLFFPSNPQKAGKMIDSIFEQCHGLADPDFVRDKENISSADSLTLNCRFLVKTLTNKSTRLYGGFRHVYMTRLSQRRGLRLLIATKQYNIKNGRWPESLDAIKSSAPAQAFIDPVNNGPFIYKTTDDSFTLYSKGENNLDENGKSDKWSFQDQGPDDWLFWPAIKYEVEKEKTNDEQQ